MQAVKSCFYFMTQLTIFGLTFVPQVDAIFSATFKADFAFAKCGESNELAASTNPAT